MKIFKTLRKRGLALFLVLTMCMNFLPATALAAELEIPQNASVEAETPAEVQALLDAAASMEAAYQALLDAIDVRGTVADEDEFYAVFGEEFSTLFDCVNAFDDAYNALPTAYAGYPGVEKAVASAGSIMEAFYGVQDMAIHPDVEKTITYKFQDAQLQEIPGTEQILKNGERLQVPAAPAAEGKQFTGWKSSDAAIAADLAASATSVAVSVPENTADNQVITYTAQYADVYYVTFSSKDGTVVYATEETKPDGSVDMTNAETAFNAYGIEPGHTLLGWATTQNSETVDFDPKNVTASVTVYPVTKAGLVFYLNGNGGILTDGVNRVEVGKTPAAPTRTGYDFAGWYTEAENGSHVSEFQAGGTYYAHWTGKKVSYTVIYWEENANDDGYSYRTSNTQTGTAGTTAQPNILKANAGFQNGTVRENVTIAGDGTTIVNVDYKREVYKITFMDGNKTYKTIEAKYGAYIGKQWPSEYQWKTGQNSNMTRAYVEIMPLDGKFVGSDGKKDSGTYYKYSPSSSEKHVRKIYLQNAENSGYTWDRDIVVYASGGTIAAWPPFDGYSLNTRKSHQTGGYWSNGTAIYEGSSWNKKLVGYSINGYYDRMEYTLAVFVDGQKDSTLSGTRKYGQAINLTGTPNVSGKTFEGWYLDPLFTKSADDVLKGTMPIGGVTVYAKMGTGDPTVQVTCEVNIEGMTDFPSISVQVPAGTEITQEWLKSKLAEKYPNINIPWNDGFRGWQVNGKLTALPVIATDGMVLTGIWNGTTFTLTYVDDDGTFLSTQSGYVKGALAPVRAYNSEDSVDYWIDPDGQQYAPGSAVPMNGHVTLKAHYRDVKVEQVTIVFDANGGTGTMQSMSAANNATVTLTQNAFTRNDGYVFKGWASTKRRLMLERWSSRIKLRSRWTCSALQMAAIRYTRCGRRRSTR